MVRRESITVYKKQAFSTLQNMKSNLNTAESITVYKKQAHSILQSIIKSSLDTAKNFTVYKKQAISTIEHKTHSPLHQSFFLGCFVCWTYFSVAVG